MTLNPGDLDCVLATLFREHFIRQKKLQAALIPVDSDRGGVKLVEPPNRQGREI